MEGQTLHITTQHRDWGENDRDMPISIAITAFSIAIYDKTIVVASKRSRYIESDRDGLKKLWWCLVTAMFLKKKTFETDQL